MKKHQYRILIGLLFLIVCLGFSFSKDSDNVIYLKNNQKLSTSGLYGLGIMKREKCFKCHAIDEELAIKNNLKSLDGYGGLRSNEWLYLFLSNPRMMQMRSKMPSFDHLKFNPVNKIDLEKFVSENDKKWKEKNLEKKWNILHKELINQSKDIKSTTFKTSEIISVISFLQQIGMSHGLKKMNKEKNIAMSKKYKEQLKEYKNSEEKIINSASNASNKTKGQKLFNMNCAVCHGTKALGDIGPNLTDNKWIYGKGQTLEIANIVVNGTKNGMPNFKHYLKPDEVGEIIAFLKTLNKNIK